VIDCSPSCTCGGIYSLHLLKGNVFLVSAASTGQDLGAELKIYLDLSRLSSCHALILSPMGRTFEGGLR